MEDIVRKITLVAISIAVLLSLVSCQQNEGEEVAVKDLVESGKAHMEAGEYEEAVTALEEASETQPDDEDAHFFLGQAYNQSGDYLKAADEFRKVLEIDPQSAAAHHNLGVTYFQLQDLQNAIAEFQAALEIDPDDPDTHYQLGAAYLVLALPASGGAPDPEFLEKATAQFERALELREDMPEALIGLGNVRIQEGNYEAAVELLQQAIDLTTGLSPQAYYALGEAYAKSGDVDQACETYQSFLNLNPPQEWQARAKQTMSALGCE